MFAARKFGTNFCIMWSDFYVYIIVQTSSFMMLNYKLTFLIQTHVFDWSTLKFLGMKFIQVSKKIFDICLW